MFLLREKNPFSCLRREVFSSLTSTCERFDVLRAIEPARLGLEVVFCLVCFSRSLAWLSTLIPGFAVRSFLCFRWFWSEIHTGTKRNNWNFAWFDLTPLPHHTHPQTPTVHPTSPQKNYHDNFRYDWQKFVNILTWVVGTVARATIASQKVERNKFLPKQLLLRFVERTRTFTCRTVSKVSKKTVLQIFRTITSSFSKTRR